MISQKARIGAANDTAPDTRGTQMGKQPKGGAHRRSADNPKK